MYFVILWIYFLAHTSISIAAISPGTLIGGSMAASNNPDDINFYSYPDTKKPSDSHKIIPGDATTLVGSGLQAGTKLTVIIHVHNTGFTAAPLHAYLKEGTKNVIWVDWEKLASTAQPGVPDNLMVLVYPAALNNVAVVGTRTAEFISFLVKNGIITGPEMVHFVGWSTGAHVASTAATLLKIEYSRVVLRLTALDPVGPLTQILKNNRLSKDKASFVDVYHTSDLLLGTAESIGHVDFYINGGLAVIQPGCPANTLQNGEVNTYFLCAHRLASTVYAKTIDPDSVQYGCKCKPIPSGKKVLTCKQTSGCKDKIRMGEHAAYGSRGNYYVKVTKNPGPDDSA